MMRRMPIFELRKFNQKRVALVEADNVESIFLDERNDRLVLVTIDGKDYRFDSLEYYMGNELDGPEYNI